MFEQFINSNTPGMRFLRTVVQGVIAALIVYIPEAIGYFNLDAATGGFLVALIMAVLSPAMAALKQADEDKMTEESEAELTNGRGEDEQ